jgi:hypothetical protein
LWLERQGAKELRCPHHQVVFTSPADLLPIWMQNRRLLTNLYFRAAWHSLREFLAYLREAIGTHTRTGKARHADEILVLPPAMRPQQYENLLNIRYYDKIPGAAQDIPEGVYPDLDFPPLSGQTFLHESASSYWPRRACACNL